MTPAGTAAGFCSYGRPLAAKDAAIGLRFMSVGLTSVFCPSLLPLHLFYQFLWREIGVDAGHQPAPPPALAATTDPSLLAAALPTT